MSWHPAHEQWGATQMQNRFQRFAKRFMLAGRLSGLDRGPRHRRGDDAGGSGEFAPVNAHIRSEEFEPRGLQGAEGHVPAAGTGRCGSRSSSPAPILPVSMSPQEGFLHEEAEVDTLGIDEPETQVQIQMSLPIGGEQGSEECA